ncbi:MAG: 23S rRNA (pseudouridine(1915)-N(3))-methyltransferase RlmH [Ginsengibacter sp.]
MKIHLWSVGKSDEPYVKEGVAVFTKRISHYYPVEWKIFSNAKQKNSLSQNEANYQEAIVLLNSLDKSDLLIALDEKGKQWSSEEVSEFIQQSANQSSRNLIFLIGGAYGLHETILQRANFTWSLSKLVFPHQLVRLILAEQIYRACTILRNEKYHHS